LASGRVRPTSIERMAGAAAVPVSHLRGISLGLYSALMIIIDAAPHVSVAN